MEIWSGVESGNGWGEVVGGDGSIGVFLEQGWKDGRAWKRLGEGAGVVGLKGGSWEKGWTYFVRTCVETGV